MHTTKIVLRLQLASDEKKKKKSANLLSINHIAHIFASKNKNNSAEKKTIISYKLHHFFLFCVLALCKS